LEKLEREQFDKQRPQKLNVVAAMIMQTHISVIFAGDRRSKTQRLCDNPKMTKDIICNFITIFHLKQKWKVMLMCKKCICFYLF